MDREKQIEKQLKEKCDLVDVISYAMRNFDDYLDECHEEEIPPIDTCEDFIADSILSAGYRKQSEGEWISVEDRLPEESCECLTVDKLGLVLQVSYSGRHRAFNASDGDDGDKWKVGGVTHWMPLPEPPKMKGGTE